MPRSATLRRLESINVAAEYLGVSPRTLRRHIASGRLTAYRVGDKTIRVDMNDVEALARPIPTAASGGAA